MSVKRENSTRSTESESGNIEERDRFIAQAVAQSCTPRSRTPPEEEDRRRLRLGDRSLKG